MHEFAVAPAAAAPASLVAAAHPTSAFDSVKGRRTP